MGWCSGTEIFDTVCKGLLSEEPKNTKELLRDLVVVMEDYDWDCQSDSDFWDHPLVQEVMRELHPTWFEG